MAKFFIERPIFAIVISIFIVLGGLIAAVNLPIAQYPQITPPRASISASYYGANAEVVEQSIGQLIEQQVNGVEDMVAMSSTSSDNGQYSLDVKFELGKNPDFALVQTQNRVSMAYASLPLDVTQAGVLTKKATPDTVMFFSLISPNGTYDVSFMKNYGSINIVEDLKRIKGVGNINEYGSDYGMRIWLQPDRMARLGITTADVSAAIQSQNLQAPVGGVGQQPSGRQQEYQYSARTQGRLETPEQFGQVIIRANSDGTFVRIQDIARVEMAVKDYFVEANTNGKASAAFAIQLTSDANALETVTKVRETIEEASKRFPQDLTYAVIVDNTKFVRESLLEVTKTFAEALLLVLIIVFIFLQSWRATLIPMLAVPVSLIGTFGAFLILGFSINTLTLFAMVLAIGLVVDDAIVVVEAVERHVRNGMDPKKATYRAMEEVSGPVVAIAFVLASVFIPVAFFGGTVGVLYKQFALTIAVSMALSAIVALSLTPALCAMLLKPHDPNAHHGKIGTMLARFNIWFDKTTERYENGVIKAVIRSKFSLVLVVALIGGAMLVSRFVPTSFVPSEDQGYFVSVVTLPEASSLARTKEVATRIASQIKEQGGVDNVIAVAGFDILAGAMKPNAAIIFTGLQPWSERKDPRMQINAKVMGTFGIGAKTPEANVLAFNVPPIQGVGTLGGFSFMLQDRGGHTVEELEQVSKEFLTAARQRPEISQIYSTFRTDTPGYRFDVDRDKAIKMGVPVSSVFSTLQAFLGGLQVNDFNRFGRTYKVIIQAEGTFRDEVEDLRLLYVRSNTGVMVPLNTLVKPVPVASPAVMKRFNGFRAVQIGGNQAPGYSTGQVLAALEEVAAQTLPIGYSYEWADQSREEKLSSGRAPVIFGLALLFVFLCLAALYESWTIPFAVLLSVPTAIFGSFLFQFARHLENSVYMQIGLVMLIGLAAKNAILIVEFAKVRMDQHGMSPMQAAVEGAKLRFRPILMTSLAFIVGCMPLVYATGAGAGARNAMGTTVVGGMLTATVLGVFLVPALFVLVETFTEHLQEWKKHWSDRHS